MANLGPLHRFCGLLFVLAVAAHAEEPPAILPAPTALPDPSLPEARPEPSPPNTPAESPPPPAAAVPAPSGGLRVEGVPIDAFLAPQLFPNSGSCGSCGGGDPGCGGCGGSTACVPGRKSCDRYPAGSTMLSRFAGAVYDGVCCPDPCYQPKWTTLANAAFFADPIRPASQMRVRYDSMFHLTTADRAEFWFSRADGQGAGPTPRSPFKGPTRVNVDAMSLYTESAVGGKFSVIFEMPYRSQEATTVNVGSGLANMTFGTKTLLMDSELFQASLQFLTIVPTGNPLKGLGPAHVALEPSLLFGVQVSCDSYLQFQIADRIPLGADPYYGGSVLHYNLSYNQVCFRPAPDVQLIGTFEASGYSFLDGAYSDPYYGPIQGYPYTYVSIGPGARASFCDKLDFGVGTAFSVTEFNLARRWIRLELRYRY